MRSDSIRYFQDAIARSKDPHQLADTLMYEFGTNYVAKQAMTDAANEVGGSGFANFVDMAHYVIQQVGGMGATAKTMITGAKVRISIGGKPIGYSRGFSIAEKEPECTCDVKALASVGCACAYSKWKAEQRAIAKAKEDFARFMSQPGEVHEIPVIRDEIQIRSPQEALETAQGNELDGIAAMFGVKRIEVDSLAETDVNLRQRTKAKLKLFTF